MLKKHVQSKSDTILSSFPFCYKKQRLLQEFKIDFENSAPSAAPVVGAACNWLSASLQPDVENSNHFLQCAPQTAGYDVFMNVWLFLRVTNSRASCGEWVRIKCADSARYSEATSTCVPTTISGSCQNNQVAGKMSMHNNNNRFYAETLDY